MVKCPQCGVDIPVEEFLAHVDVCPNRIKDTTTAVTPLTQYQDRLQAIIQLHVDSAGNIVYPLGKSPTKVYDVCTGGRATDSSCLAKIISDLYEAEQVAYTQYSEALKIKALEKFYPQIEHIRKEEYEHMQILAQILTELGYKVPA